MGYLGIAEMTRIVCPYAVGIIGGTTGGELSRDCYSHYVLPVVHLAVATRILEEYAKLGNWRMCDHMRLKFGDKPDFDAARAILAGAARGGHSVPEQLLRTATKIAPVIVPASLYPRDAFTEQYVSN